jgi:hypothetical protein
MSRLARAALTVALVVPTILATGLHASPARAAGSGAGGLAVSVAYAEDKETNNPNPATFPIPWQSSPNVVFLGGPVVGQTQCGTLPSCFDTGAIRLDNPTGSDVAVSGVSVDIHSSISGGKVFNLWGSFTVPAGKSVILAENPPGDAATSDDFDTSGYPGNVCTPITVVPTVTVTVAGVPTTLADNTHVLDTGGIDLGFCGLNGSKNESIQWRPIGSAGSSSATLTLTPGAGSQPVGGSATETATLLDGAGTAVANVGVAFSVVSGPNAGRTGSATTDAAGHAAFTYSDTAAGTDIVAASVTTVGTFSSQAIVTWGSAGPTWSGMDIGSPPFAGSDAFAGGIWTITGSGRDIGGTTDQFHYVSQPLASDGSISARVLTQTNSNSRARAGVMLRQSTDPSAPFYAAVVTPGSGIWVFERASFGGQVSTLANPAGIVPVYLRVDRTGSSVGASTSPDGVVWTPIAGSAGTFAVSGAVLAGLAVTSHSSTKTSTATFDQVSVSGIAAPPPPNDFSIAAAPPTVSGAVGGSGSASISTALVSGVAESISLSASGLPAGVGAAFAPSSVSAGGSSTLTFNIGTAAVAGSYPITVSGSASSATHTRTLTLAVSSSSGGLPGPWLDTDVGAPSPAGSATYAGGVFTLNGSGADIFGASDQFNYLYQSAGNGTIIARVSSQSNTGSTNSKAGVIWKASTAPLSPYINIETGPSGVVKVQYNFSGSIAAASTYSFPNVWMKLVRSGSNFSAYLSSDGLVWTAVVTNKSLPTIPTAATVGIFECSHKPGTLGIATFDNVSFTPGP